MHWRPRPTQPCASPATWPALADALLEEVARAYLQEATNGPADQPAASPHGSTDPSRPSATGLVGAARRRGYLSPGQPGGRGAAPGPRLTGEQEGDTRSDDAVG